MGRVLRFQILESTPTMGPIHVAKDISLNRHGLGIITTSQVTDSFSKVYAPQIFYEEVRRWAWQRMKDGLRA